MIIVFDTNVLIDLTASRESTIREVKGVVEKLPVFDCAITWVNFFEYYCGAQATQEESFKSLDFLNKFTFLPMDKEATKLFSLLKKSKVIAKDFDLLIAAVCIANGALLLTRDRDFECIPNLKYKLIE